MLEVLTPQQMAECDRLTIAGGTPGAVLMERAGAAVAARVERLCGGAYGRRVVVLAGKGNNGGDGLVVARKLHRKGALVRVALAEAPSNLTGESRAMYERLVPSRIPVGLPDVDLLAEVCRESDVIVDALFGTGFSGVIKGDLAGWVRAANASGKPIVAVDIPSGVSGSDGVADGPVISADLTVAIQALKAGHVMGAGVAASGRIEIADIAIDTSRLVPFAEVAEGGEIAALMPRRRTDDHKWSAGSVLVVGGSRSMSGAALMAARSALIAAAGIVTVALPESVQMAVASASPETMTVGLEETSDGAIDADSADEVIERAARFGAIAIGPGLGSDPSTGEMVRSVLAGSSKPAVVDADALNLLGREAVEVIGTRTAPTVMTPHPGEMGRMLGASAEAVDADRVSIAQTVAEKWGCVVLLKGPRTVISAPGTTPAVNPTGGPELATAGAGDVLTGVIAGFIAAGGLPRDAAISGAFVHGLAGQMAGEGGIRRGVHALAIAEALPAAMAAIEEGQLP